jgi:hypothetical protein
MPLAHSIRLLIAGAAITAGFGSAVAASAAANDGVGHTPVTLCHFVPAHGGSYVVITVDDSGSTANPAGKGHLGHADDIIPANPDGTCGPVLPPD